MSPPNRSFAHFPLMLGLLILALAWAGPLPAMVQDSFTAHMALHMMVVGLGVPLLAMGLAPRLTDSALMRSQLTLPIIVSLADLIVVWGWHAPKLHGIARGSMLGLTLEQLSFFIVSLLVWLIAVGSTEGRRQEAALAGAVALFFTSMHMTLLGALLALSGRDLFPDLHQGHGMHAVHDQQIGGAIMLVIGGVIYLSGGLILVARVLRRQGVNP